MNSPEVRTRPAPPAPPAAAPASGRLRRWGAKALAVLASYRLAVTLILLLLLLTALGTFAQAHMSLYDVQRRYFDALVVVVDVGPVSIPLPGAALTIAVLSLNLIVGGVTRLLTFDRRVRGVVRLRRGWATVGVLVTHMGILLLFVGGLIETLASDKGQMTLYEPRTAGAAEPLSASERFSSFYEWELAVAERAADDTLTEHVIPWSRLQDLEGRTLRATSAGLPFDILVQGWTANVRPRPAVGPGVNGWAIEPLEPAMDAENNTPMARVTLAAPGGAAGPQGLVWGLQQLPWSALVDGRSFEVYLRHRSWGLPFRIRLNRFVHELHPGTSMDSRFSSFVTKIEDGVERDVHITMNEPLRHRGYTFYQSGWGPRDAKPGVQRFSTFSVVRNPSDRWPIAACAVIFLGMLIHFGRRLLKHVRSESRQAQAPGAAA